MNRVFYARIAWYQYVMLILLATTLIVFLWYKYIVPAMFLIFILVVLIEQIIHTTYTITSDNQLIISCGRFTRKKIIPIQTITHILKHNSMRIAGRSVTNYVLIEYGQRKFVSAMPIKEDEFIEQLYRKMEKLTT